VTGSIHVNAAGFPSTISGILSLSAATHNFNIADGSAADDC